MEAPNTMSTGMRAGQTVPRLLVSPRDAAKLLSVSERTLFTLTKAGTIPVVRIGRCVRYSVTELQEWVRRGSQKKCENGQNCT